MGYAQLSFTRPPQARRIQAGKLIVRAKPYPGP